MSGGGATTRPRRSEAAQGPTLPHCGCWELPQETRAPPWAGSPAPSTEVARPPEIRSFPLPAPPKERG